MRSLPPPLRRPTLLLAAAGATIWSLGAVAPAVAEPCVALDGDVSDWPVGVAAQADERYVYFRIPSTGAAPLQAAPVTTAIVLDLDADSDSGVQSGALGADFTILLSPPDRANPGALLRGASGVVMDRAGRLFAVEQRDLGLECLPTFAAPVHEARLSRLSPLVSPLMGSTSAILRGRFERRDATGAVLWTSDQFEILYPDAAASPLRSEAPPPAAGEGEVRVLSWNVLWASPVSNPEPFARVLRFLNPDIVLLQEWDEREREKPRIEPAAIESWFSTHVSSAHEWRAITSAERGVSIIARHPIDPALVRQLAATVGADAGAALEQPVRFVAGLIRTPVGELVAGSMHLKCCGSAGTAEDILRVGEAVAINAAMRKTLTDGGKRIALLGGDFNLVGSSIPLQVIRAGLDTDGSDLQTVDAVVWGDATRTTWRDPKEPFPPGRLDYLTMSDSTAEVVRSFLLDTSLLSDAALSAAGLERADTSASDHLPLVADIRPR